MTPTPMSFLIFGAGAIGTYIGGSLALAGHKVVFLERPEGVQALHENGLSLAFDGQVHQIRRPLVASEIETALALGPYDAAVFALKSFDTPMALKQVAPLAGEMPPVLCLSNGVDNEALLAEVLGEQKVIAGTVTSAIGRRAFGQIALEKRRGMGLSANHTLSRRLAQALNQANLNAFLYPRPASMKWSKLLTNLLGNATSAILDMPPGEVFADPGLYRLEIAQLREALGVMRALGAGPVNLPRTPVRLLALAADPKALLGVPLPLGLSRPLLQRAVGGGRGAKMPSFHIDLHAGRGQSEVEYLNGAVARHGEQAGVPAPVNRRLTEILLALTNGSLPLEAYARQPQKLLADIRDSSRQPF